MFDSNLKLKIFSVSSQHFTYKFQRDSLGDKPMRHRFISNHVKLDLTGDLFLLAAYLAQQISISLGFMISSDGKLDDKGQHYS